SIRFPPVHSPSDEVAMSTPNILSTRTTNTGCSNTGCSNRARRVTAGMLVGCAAWVVLATPNAWADGFHGAAMSTKSLDDWMRDLKTQVPQIADQLSTADLKAGIGAEGLKKKLEELKNK